MLTPRETNRLKVGISHIGMRRGGSEAAVMWAIQALRDAYDVTLITAAPFELDELNAFYGTRIAPSDCKLLRYKPPSCLRRRRGLDAVHGHLFQRFCRDVAGQFDLLISGYNPCDFGVPAIHLVADLCWDPELVQQLAWNPGGEPGGVSRLGQVRLLYLRMARLCGRPSGRDLFGGEDLMLANSTWTADILRRRHGARWVAVLHPPVVYDGPSSAALSREAGFICLGRVTHEKQIDRMIEILSLVRRRGHDIRFHIVGQVDPASAYGGRIEALARQHRAWIQLRGTLVGREKHELLARQAFGIHACTCEAFGIAVAEMAQAGVIPFVPAVGGPAEIVADPRLSYGDIDEAVDKIDRVLRAPGQQRELRQHLLRQGKRFSAQGFMRGIIRAADEFLARRKGLAA